MRESIAKHQDKIAGTLSGFDRLVFRGPALHRPPPGHDDLSLAQPGITREFWRPCRRGHEGLKEASLAEAQAYGRPVKYLNSGKTDKETIARNILAQDGVRGGLVCVLSGLEPCWKFEIHRNRQTRKLELQLRSGTCLLFLFLHHYQIHPVFGFLNAPIPSKTVGLNGRTLMGTIRFGSARLRRSRCI
jgi:hypothetical protein